MKNIFLLIGLMILTLFVVSCAPGEKALAGQAVSTSSIYLMKGDYFALSDVVGKIHLYQYKGADAPTKENAKILLKDIETGETKELNYVYQSYAAGIKGGSILKVGLYQSYAGGIDESKDYYLLFRAPKEFRAPKDSTSVDSPLIVSFDSDGKEKLSLKAVTLKI